MASSKLSSCVLTTCLLVAACGDPVIDDALATIKGQLKDPDSAKFDEVHRCGTSKFVSGRVNAKNSLGGYTGPTDFVVGNGKSSLANSGDTNNFIMMMNKCIEAIKSKPS